LFANFFARTRKLVVDYLLILSFNLITLDFANNERLLKTITTIFLKNLFVLTNLLIATTTREIKEITNEEAKIERNVDYIDILKVSRLHANWIDERDFNLIAQKTTICVMVPSKPWHLPGCDIEICSNELAPFVLAQ